MSGFFGGGGGVSFDDTEGDPADTGTTADGTSSYAARRDHVHAIGAADVVFADLSAGVVLAMQVFG